VTFDFAEIAEMTGGKLMPAGAKGQVTGISTDSRTIRPGELFIPLRGPNFDGHDFLARALRNGAAACLSEEVIAGFPVPVIRVGNTLEALGSLGQAARRRFSGPVVAVTGSSGKTTTKEMLAGILGLTGPGLKTQGNYNNLIGLPLTLFQLQPEHRWAVLEMGMSARGEIARLAEIGRPNVGIITNVGEAHLETLHGLDGVARAKGELFAALVPGCTAVINADDERVAAIPVANGVQRLLFGLTEQAAVRAENLRGRGSQVSFELVHAGSRLPVTLHVAGKFNVSNALAAAAAALALNVPLATIAEGLERFRPVSGRMETVPLANGVTLIEDTYNANPLSMTAALRTLVEMNGGRRCIAVLGDMLELGETSGELHRQVGETAAVCTDLLLVLGEHAADVAAGARAGGLAAARVRVLANHDQAIALLQELLQPGDRVLVKGSRGMRMERISSALRGETRRTANGKE